MGRSLVVFFAYPWSFLLVLELRDDVIFIAPRVNNFVFAINRTVVAADFSQRARRCWRSSSR